jgi:hypothetical protein
LKPLSFVSVVFVLVLTFSMPVSPWEFDEPLFFQALHRYEPLAHHPPPPGYPLYIGAGNLARLLIPSDFEALRAISLAASTVALLMLALAFRNLSGDLTTGTVGAALFSFSPAMLVHATLPISEPGALALLATALYFGSRSSPAWFAVFAALTVGWRLQFAIFVVPLFLAAVLLMKSWRDRGVALLAFTLVCLAWLVPLVIAVGGLEETVRFEAAQGRYVAAFDADQARSGWTPLMIAIRFTAHPWGGRPNPFRSSRSPQPASSSLRSGRGSRSRWPPRERPTSRSRCGPWIRPTAPATPSPSFSSRRSSPR